MDYDAQVVKFLSKRENLLFAFEISERLEQVKDKFQNEFWLGVRDVVKRRLVQSGKAGKWELHFPDKPDLQRWIYCNLSPTNATEEQYYLGIGLQQWGSQNSCRFAYGVWWCEPFNGEIKWPPVQRLVERLSREGFENANSD